MSDSRVDILPSVQAALGSAFTVERELGGGGMSRVFVATETALARRVAIKVLSPDLLQGVSAERFAREVALAAQLQDPHIVPVLTTGTTSDGLPFFTMPYIEGESLRERMLRGPVPLEEALRILRDVAEALEYAHARGIVHRDIKPENVLLSGRSAVVADFGIAKAVSAARATVPGGTLTSVGLSLGTPAYMAPEQAAGDPVDLRADLYSWGMVAYELLGGVHPFAHCEGMAQLITAQITAAPAALNTVKPGLPPSLNALVMRCLAKKPSDRPADAASVIAELGSISTDPSGSGRRLATAAMSNGRGRRIGLVAAGLVVLLGGGAWMATRDASADGVSGRTAAAAATPSLAVLPFEHQGDSADVYLTEGITDEIRNKLAGVSNLLVIARASSNQYRQTDKTPQQVAEELGVRWLLTGTVQVIGSGAQRRVLVRPELVEVTADGRLQSRGGAPFDGPLTDVVKVQADVAGQVVRSMEVRVGGADQARLVEVPTQNAEAYDLVLRGRAAVISGGSVTAVKRGLEFFEAAAARDSALLEAWRMIGASYALLYLNETPSPEYARRARAALAQLERLAPGSVDFHRLRADVRSTIDGDIDGALEDAQTARRLYPGDVRTLGLLAEMQSEKGQLVEALARYDSALVQDPRIAGLHSLRASILTRLRRFDDARAAAARARALAPSSVLPFTRAHEVALASGDLAAAQEIVRAAAADIPRQRLISHVSLYWFRWWALEEADTDSLLALPASAFDVPDGRHAVVAQVWYQRGEQARARAHADSSLAELAVLLKQTPRDAQLHVLQGLMYAYAGRPKQAMAAAERGIEMARVLPGATYSAALAYYRYLAARAATVAGERERAIAWLRESLAGKSQLTAGWVRIDPTFAPLRGDPAFERVLAEAP